MELYRPACLQGTTKLQDALSRAKSNTVFTKVDSGPKKRDFFIAREELGLQLHSAKTDGVVIVDYSKTAEQDLYKYLRDSSVWSNETSPTQDWTGYVVYVNSNATARVTFTPMDDVRFQIIVKG